MLTKTIKELTIVELLQDAEELILEQAAAGKPLVAAYKTPCGCGDKRCEMTYSVTIVPYEKHVAGFLKEIH